MSLLRSRSGGKCDGRARDPLGEAGMEVFGERSVARRDDADVDRIAAVEADRAHLAGREHAVEPLLGLGGQAADFVEDERAAVGLDELADLGREGAREGAFLMAEQLTVDDVGGDCLAVEASAAAPWREGWRRGSRGRWFPCRCRLSDHQHRQAVRARLGCDSERGRGIRGGPDELSSSSAGPASGDRRKLADGRDVNALDKLLSDKFQFIHSNGRLEFKSDLIKKEGNETRTKQIDSSDSIFHCYPGVAIVSNIVRLRMTAGADAGSETIRRHRVSYVWVEEPQGWRLLLRQTARLPD